MTPEPGAESDAPTTGLPAGVVMFATRFCGYCQRARTLLERKGVRFEEIRVDRDPRERRRMRELAGANSVPQIFIDGRHVGGCDQLYALEQAGALDPLLADAAGRDAAPDTN
jgi:glutaredoxin 3